MMSTAVASSTPTFTIEPINRFLHAGAIQSFLDTLKDELFPHPWPPVTLDQVPNHEDDVWLAVYNEAGWLEGLIYALHFPGLDGHNVHIAMSPRFRGRDLLPVLDEAMRDLFILAELDELYAIIPCHFRRVRWLVAKIGFKPTRPWLWFMSRREYNALYSPN